MDILVQCLQILPGGILAQAEDLAGGSDIGAAGGGGVGPHEHVLVGGIQQVVPGGGLGQALGGQLLLEPLLVDDDAQNAHVPALPQVIGVVEPRVQVVVVGGVILQERAGLRQRAVQVHGAAHQEVRLGIVHLRLHAGHGVAAAQGDILDLDAGILLELLRDGDGVVLVQSGVHHQLAAGLRLAVLLLSALIRGWRVRPATAASQQRHEHQRRKRKTEKLLHRSHLLFAKNDRMKIMGVLSSGFTVSLKLERVNSFFLFFCLPLHVSYKTNRFPYSFLFIFSSSLDRNSGLSGGHTHSKIELSLR